MKRNITKFLAALALLVFTMPSLVAWGQTDVIDRSVTESSLGNTATNQWVVFSVEGTSGAEYQIRSMGIKSSTEALRWNANGWLYMSATSTSGAKLKSITITTTANKSISLYASNTAYSEAPSGTALATIAATSQGTTYTFGSDYTYLALKGTASSTFINSISIVWETPSSVATPTFSPVAGLYTSAQNVTISTTTSGATIYYTTDGTDPTTSSNVYSSAIPVSSTTTIKAMAVASGVNSSIASATYVIVEHAGTEADPYTVADARAAIDAGVGLSNVYATGIVSEIVTPYGDGGYNNITFNMVDEEGDTEFLQAFRCVGTDAPNVIVGDIAVVYGNLTKYGATYEFGQGCTVVSLTHPAGTVLDPVFNPAAGGYSGTQSVEITCATEGATIYYTTDGTDPTTSSAQYSSAISVSSNTTIKAVAYVGTNHSEVVTASYLLLTDANTTVNTVAYALANYPLDGVFVSGIVCTAPTQAPTSNGELTYYISSNGTETDRLEVYKGKNMDNTAFSEQTDLQVGDIVTVYGNVVIYNSTIEFTTGNYLVAFERPETPVVPVINAPATVTLEYDATSGEFEYSIENPVQGTNLNATTTAEWISNIVVGESAVTFTTTENEGEEDRSATITLSYEGADNVTVTVTQGHYTESYTGEGTFNKVTALTDLEDGGYYVLAYDNHALKASYYGSTTNEMASETVTVANDMIVNPAKLIVWKLEAGSNNNWNLFNEEEGKYCNITTNSTTGFALAETAIGYTVSVSDPAATYTFATTASGNRCISYYSNNNSFRSYAASNATTKLTLYKLGEASQDPYFTVDNVEIDYNVEEGSIAYTLNNPVSGGAVTAEVTDGEWLTLGSGTTSPISFTCSANTDYTSREATVTLTYTYNNSKPAVTATVTVTQGAAPYPATTYTLATNIVSGKHYIITNGTDKAMGAQGSNNRPAVGVEIEDGVATVRSADVYEFVINGPDSDGYYTIYDAKEPGYLYAASSSSNHLKTEAHLDANNNALWTISISTDGDATIVAQGNNTNKYMRFNNTLFSCYGESSSVTALPYLYMKDNDTNYEFYKDIAAYQGDGGYYLIASPVNNVNPANVVGMASGDFDLYEYDDTQNKEWLNWKGDQELSYEGHFNLVSGKGYLYAKSEDVTLAFTGTPYSGNGQVPVVAGWNLVGNPFSVAATPSVPYYRLDSDGGELNAETESGTVNAMEGVFVNATEAGNVTFSTASNKSAFVALNVTRNRGNVIDRAVVRFDEGQQLPKFQLNPNSTKVYVTEGNQDFAIVRSAAQGEMPVSFKASENGTYTLAVEAENVEMDYLHLIDNMTGMDVDLLQTPNYTFEAKTNDYASRFRLVFSASNNGTSTAETFAFFNGTSWTVSNQGEATLQVVDVMGRLVSSETINGNATINLNETAGIYMLRLVNGNDVKVQKIVVR